MELGATWASERCPCLWQGVEMRWALKILSHSKQSFIPWLQSQVSSFSVEALCASASIYVKPFRTTSHYLICLVRYMKTNSFQTVPPVSQGFLFPIGSVIPCRFFRSINVVRLELPVLRFWQFPLSNEKDFSCFNFCLSLNWKKENSRKNSQVLGLWLKQQLELFDGAPQSLQCRSSPPDAIVFLPAPH